MSDNEQSEGEDKSHEPTQQKLKQSREKGDVPYSNEATAALTYAAFFLAIFTFVGWSFQSIYSGLAPLLHDPDEIGRRLLSDENEGFLGDFILRVTVGPLPILILLAIAAIASVICQQAFTVSLSKIKPKLSRLSVISNAKQKYGPNGLSEFVKSFTKLAAVLSIVLFAMKDRFLKLPGLSELPPNAILPLLQKESVYFLGLITATAVLIAAVDLPWRQFQHRSRLRMTFQELKKENKETEGEPGLKNERRRRAEAIAVNRMMTDVPTADIVIVNPTHYAIALKWARKSGDIPVCVAKGVDETAARIRSIAAESGIPIKRDPPTARSIYALVDIGQEIKREHYGAVAAAIHYADTIQKKKRQMT